MNLHVFSFEEVALRVFLACAAGFFIGIDREQKHKPLSYPAFMIITTITCLIAMMGQELNAQYIATNRVELDMGKIIAGVFTGIGFLGAGAIIKRDGGEVVGTATGASIWASGGLGLLLGFGFYAMAGLGFVVIWVTLSFLEPLANRLRKKQD